MLRINSGPYLPLALLPLLAFAAYGQTVTEPVIAGQVTDPQVRPVSNLRVQLLNSAGDLVLAHTTGNSGEFLFTVSRPGTYTLKVNAPNFQKVTRNVRAVAGHTVTAKIQLGSLAEKQDSITVTADVKDSNILYPDPAQRVYVRQETLDANSGRPGAPISIPGSPIETASGGIKAPQYFSPGVAGDHGEPIAEYIQVGTYLLSNNLSSNAHGNGYADPNIMVPAVLDGVQTDGGAFNVREGNHAENLSAIYQLRSRFEPFISVTGDYRDVDLVAGWSPEGPRIRSWVAVEAAYGNGFLDRLERRQQYKMNGFRVFEFAHHQVTLFGIGYYGFSYLPGLVPLNVPGLRDTIDPRQRDQTHTGELALNDVWTLSPHQQLQLSGLFRTYNLSLYSNFGDSLIRQSEFRTVTGGNATYVNNLPHNMSLLAGIDYQRDAPRRLDLDHYDSTDPSYYGPFFPSPQTTSHLPTPRLTYRSMAQCFAISTTISAGVAMKYSSTTATCSHRKTLTADVLVLTLPKPPFLSCRATIRFCPPLPSVLAKPSIRTIPASAMEPHKERSSAANMLIS